MKSTRTETHETKTASTKWDVVKFDVLDGKFHDHDPVEAEDRAAAYREAVKRYGNGVIVAPSLPDDWHLDEF